MDAAMIGFAAVSLIAGALLGVVYFGGLWLTTLHLTESRRPGVVAFGSFLFRLLLAGVVLAWAARGGVLPAVTALAGFLAVRGVAVRLADPVRDDARG